MGWTAMPSAVPAEIRLVQILKVGSRPQTFLKHLTAPEKNDNEGPRMGTGCGRTQCKRGWRPGGRGVPPAGTRERGGASGVCGQRLSSRASQSKHGGGGLLRHVGAPKKGEPIRRSMPLSMPLGQKELRVLFLWLIFIESYFSVVLGFDWVNGGLAARESTLGFSRVGNVRRQSNRRSATAAVMAYLWISSLSSCFR